MLVCSSPTCSHHRKTLNSAESHKLVLLMFSRWVRVCLVILALLAVSPQTYAFHVWKTSLELLPSCDLLIL